MHFESCTALQLATVNSTWLGLIDRSWKHLNIVQLILFDHRSQSSIAPLLGGCPLASSDAMDKSHTALERDDAGNLGEGDEIMEEVDEQEDGYSACSFKSNPLEPPLTLPLRNFPMIVLSPSPLSARPWIPTQPRRHQRPL